MARRAGTAQAGVAGAEAGQAGLRAALRGDCHSHSDWSDGGSPPAEMAQAARDLGHEWVALTDHSPRLTVANGLSAERLRAQLELVDALNEQLAPFRILTGIEVDILEDGALDQREDLLRKLDVVVASVHSQLRMPAGPMTAGWWPRSATRTRTCSGTAPAGCSAADAAAGRSRSSTPRRSSPLAASTASRSRSTAGPSGRTRPTGCCGWPPSPAACSLSTPTRTRPGSWTGSLTGDRPGASEFGIPAERVIDAHTADAGLLAWTELYGRSSCAAPASRRFRGRQAFGLVEPAPALERAGSRVPPPGSRTPATG